MAELLEYFLVVMASTLFIAGSVATYDSFVSFESQVQFRADANTISGLISEAMHNGSSEAALALPSSTLLCNSGNFTLSSGSLTSKLALPLACDFKVKVSAGSHLVRFATNASDLVVRVS